MKTSRAVHQFYILPCCLLLLNLAVELVSYKARVIDDVLLRTAAIMGMVLFGASLVGFAACARHWECGRNAVSTQSPERRTV
jgi:hypothetical protein